MEQDSSEAPEDHHNSSNITSDQLDPETASKLRGDAIGDTMYSEIFVLNTLIQFSDLKWSSEVEDNLCFLWDMTEEFDVCKYLFEKSYPSLASSAIRNYNEPRFIEIVVGIFANLLCSKCEKNIKEEEIDTVLDLLNSNDPHILIQVMRFIHALAYIYEKLEFIKGEHLERIDFILFNSTNKELLSVTLKTLTSITESLKISQNLVKGEWLKSAVVAFRGFRETSESEYESFEAKDAHVNVKYLLQILCNLCSYIDSLNEVRLYNEIKPHLDEFISEIVILLTFYRIEDNLLPVDENFKFYIEALCYICKILSVGYISSLCKVLYDIVFTIYRKALSSLDSILELFCYFISVGNIETFRKDFGDVRVEDVKEALQYIEDNNFFYDFEYRSNLRLILLDL